MTPAKPTRRSLLGILMAVFCGAPPATKATAIPAAGPPDVVPSKVSHSYDAPGSPEKCCVYQYDAEGRLVSATDSFGPTTTFDFPG